MYAVAAQALKLSMGIAAERSLNYTTKREGKLFYRFQGMVNKVCLATEPTHSLALPARARECVAKNIFYTHLSPLPDSIASLKSSSVF
jgi:hypothetical protein